MIKQIKTLDDAVVEFRSQRHEVYGLKNLLTLYPVDVIRYRLSQSRMKLAEKSIIGIEDVINLISFGSTSNATQLAFSCIAYQEICLTNAAELISLYSLKQTKEESVKRLSSRLRAERLVDRYQKFHLRKSYA